MSYEFCVGDMVKFYFDDGDLGYGEIVNIHDYIDADAEYLISDKKYGMIAHITEDRMLSNSFIELIDNMGMA